MSLRTLHDHWQNHVKRGSKHHRLPGSLLSVWLSVLRIPVNPSAGVFSETGNLSSGTQMIVLDTLLLLAMGTTSSWSRTFHGKLVCQVPQKFVVLQSGITTPLSKLSELHLGWQLPSLQYPRGTNLFGRAIISYTIKRPTPSDNLNRFNGCNLDDGDHFKLPSYFIIAGSASSYLSA